MRTEPPWSGRGWRATGERGKDNPRVYTVAFRVCRNSRRTKPVEALAAVLGMVIFLFRWTCVGTLPHP
ncbi:MAG: hypothetical protein ACTSWF_09005 [Candidatus Freyarchaeota archaeon]